MSEARTIYVCGAEGEDVPWPLCAARLAGTLKDWIDDTEGEGSFPAPDIPADTLRTLLSLLTTRLATAGVPATDATLASFSIDKLCSVARAANFLAATDVLTASAQELCRRLLTGKSVEDLRVALGVGLDEWFNDEQQAAALSELVFTPDDAPPKLAAVEPRSASFAAALEAGHPMPVDVAIDDDTLDLVLHEADGKVLCLLKGVSVSWLARARRALCARLCQPSGLLAMTHRHLACIESLNVEHLSAAGRLYDLVVAAGRHELPNLATLNGYKFSVSLSALREAKLHKHYPTSNTQDELQALDEQDLEPEELDFEQMELLHAFEDGTLACTALLNCTSREAACDGEPSRDEVAQLKQLLVAAIACVCSGVVFGVPIKRLRCSECKTLSLDGIGPDAAHLLALFLPGTKIQSLMCASAAPPMSVFRRAAVLTHAFLPYMLAALAINRCQSMNSWDLSLSSQLSFRAGLHRPV